jgi:hypothetical protein
MVGAGFKPAPCLSPASMPDPRPRRRSLRLSAYDYSPAGASGLFREKGGFETRPYKLTYSSRVVRLRTEFLLEQNKACACNKSRRGHACVPRGATRPSLPV